MEFIVTIRDLEQKTERRFTVAMKGASPDQKGHEAALQKAVRKAYGQAAQFVTDCGLTKQAAHLGRQYGQAWMRLGGAASSVSGRLTVDVDVKLLPA